VDARASRLRALRGCACLRREGIEPADKPRVSICCSSRLREGRYVRGYIHVNSSRSLSRAPPASLALQLPPTSRTLHLQEGRQQHKDARDGAVGSGVLQRQLLVFLLGVSASYMQRVAQPIQQHGQTSSKLGRPQSGAVHAAAGWRGLPHVTGQFSSGSSPSVHAVG
jgi:hypothetical protein